MRVGLWVLVAVSAVGCARFSGPASPEEAVRGYLVAKTLNDRLPFILDSESMRPLLGMGAEMSQFGFSQVSVEPSERLAHTGEWYSVRAATRRGSQTAAMRFYVGRVADSYRIDWQASIGHNTKPLATVLADPTETPQRFRVKARQATYYYHEFWGTEALYESFELSDGGSRNTVYGFVRRQTDIGRKLGKLIQDGAEHPVTLELHRVGPRGDPILDPQSNVVKITNLISDSWLE